MCHNSKKCLEASVVNKTCCVPPHKVKQLYCESSIAAAALLATRQTNFHAPFYQEQIKDISLIVTRQKRDTQINDLLILNYFVQ